MRCCKSSQTIGHLHSGTKTKKRRYTQRYPTGLAARPGGLALEPRGLMVLLTIVSAKQMTKLVRKNFNS